MHLLLLFIQHASDFSTSVEGRAYNPPDSLLYYAILTVCTIIVLATTVYSIKWLIRPGEQAEDHIKRIILDTDQEQL